MAVNVEDGTGLTDSNSFVSLTDATSYHEARGQDTAWAAISSDKREDLLVQATDFLNDEMMFPWRGTRKTTEQALAWPRSGVQERYGQSVGDSVVPTRVANATAELALILNSTELHPTIQFDKGNIRKEKVDVIETEYFSDRFVSHDPRSYTAIVTKVMGRLYPLLRDGHKDFLEAVPQFTLPDRDTTVLDPDRPLFYDGVHDNQQG